MTDEQIIKALEYCSTDVRENTCPKCAFYKKHRCSTLMLNAVSDLIYRQKAENERLLQKLQQAKSEAIKEFAERLKSISIGLEIGGDKRFKMMAVSTIAIDKFAKEMTEVQK